MYVVPTQVLKNGNPFDTSECSSNTNDDGFTLCGETFAHDVCTDATGGFSIV